MSLICIVIFYLDDEFLYHPISPIDTAIILEHLPARIRDVLIARVPEIDYPIETVIEMVIAS